MTYSKPRRKKYLVDLKEGVVVGTFWTHVESGHNQEGTQLFKSIISAKEVEFDNPKPLRLIKRLLQIASKGASDIILDFFSGSGTTAHAVMQSNAEEGMNRKFICIQIPESLDSCTETPKGPYKTIADIGKERIRRTGDKIQTEWQEKRTGQLPLDEVAPTPPDVGFRVFCLDSSNLIPWDDSFVSPDQPELFLERMDGNHGEAKPGRREIDVVYEVLIKHGVPLTEKISTLEIDEKRFYVIGETGYLFICLTPNVAVSTIEAAIKHNPGAMIFSEHCFTDDNDLTNTGLALDKAEIEFRWI